MKGVSEEVSHHQGESPEGLGAAAFGLRSAARIYSCMLHPRSPGQGQAQGPWAWATRRLILSPTSGEIFPPTARGESRASLPHLTATPHCHCLTLEH